MENQDAAEELLTPEDKAEWQSLKATQQELERSLREVERKKEALVARIFRHHLTHGKWKVEARRYYVTLSPANREAEDALDDMLAAALRLGHHGRFRIYDGKVNVEGALNDGKVTIHINPERLYKPLQVKDVQDELRALQVDVDLVEYAKGALHSAIAKAKEEVEDAKDTLEELRACLAEFEKPSPS